MSKVYFKKIKSLDNVDLINNESYKMLERIINDEGLKLESVTPLKVHFGEPGNVTYIKPKYFEGIRRYLKDNNISSCYIETNVLYKGERTFEDSHKKVAQNHDFTDLDVVIADGDIDNPYNEVEINKEFFKTCKIGKKFSDYNNYIVVAHFKGHGLAGFGGAIKQLGMGFAARGGKLEQHSDTVPVISQNKCVSCGVCVKKCPVDAITIDKKASIIKEKCIGCASCTIVCPVHAITNTWDGANFHEKLAEYAYAAALNKTNIYINYVFNVTSDCDCVGNEMPIVAPDIGLFVSTDPVAVDKASLDKLQDCGFHKLFDKGKKNLEHAQKIGLGSLDYELIEM